MSGVEMHARESTFSSVNTAETAVGGSSPSPSKLGNTSPATGPGSQLPEFIPPNPPYRTLVLCFDGTGDQFDADNSNVVEFFRLLKKDDPSKQLVYYQSGIGTYTTPQIFTPLLARLSKLFDQMFAWNLDSHIIAGYEFLMQNYRANDRICIFGFSRGAYTARCLAGMVHKVGLLPACNHQQVPFAYKMYTKAKEKDWKQSNNFKMTFSIDVDIEIVGVWDTVSSVGLIPHRRMPFTTSNTVVHTFRHAVSLDERRARFQPNLWNRPDAQEQLLSITDKKLQRQKKNAKNDTGHHSLRALENRYSKPRGAPTNIEEVWFSGCHCDVGGGSVSNGVKPCLARIPLRWMIRECFRTNTGILFHTEGLKSVGLDPSTLYPVVAPRPRATSLITSSPETSLIQSIPKKSSKEVDGEEDALSVEGTQESEELAELKDVLAPMYDQLNLKWFWWILELFPMKHRYQKSNDLWSWWFGSNFGHGRRIHGQSTKGVKVHRSAQMRLAAQDAGGNKYTPKANLDLKSVTWVD